MQYRILILISAVVLGTQAPPARAQDEQPELPFIAESVDYTMLFPPSTGAPSPCVLPSCYDSGDFDGDTLALTGWAYAAIYVFVRDANGQFSPQATLVNPDPSVLASGDPDYPLEYDRHYGRPVSLQRDELAVAARYENQLTGTIRLQVFLFRRYGTRWFLRQTIVPDVEGDFSRIVALQLDEGVLAIKVDNSTPDSEPLPCTVSVYRRWWGRYYREALLELPSGSGEGPGLGLDGRILAVGAIDHAPAGAVHVYERGLLRWRLLQTIMPESLPYHDFGTAVAVDGARIAVGAPDDRIPGPGEMGEQLGLVETFYRRGERYELEQRLMSPQPRPRGWTFRLGATISLRGERMLVGSSSPVPRLDGPATILFKRTDAGWTPSAALGSGYGKVVALSEDSGFVLYDWFRGGGIPAVFDLP